MEETVTLYLGLREGEKADFEVVGLAAAAFSESVKEIAYVLEPGLEIRVQFESGVAGSLKLKASIKALKPHRGQRGVLLAIVVTVALTLANDIRQYAVGKLLDHLLEADQRQQLSDEDVQRIANAVKGVRTGKIAKEPVQEMYKQLERDESIESVGAVVKPDDKPISPIPRSEFAMRAGIAKEAETSPSRRTKPSTERLTLISPVLLLAQRAWRFRSPEGFDCSYIMADEKFLSQIFLGRRRVPMKEGIEMTVDIETQEELVDGVWMITRRFITKVRRMHNKVSKQPDLFATSVKRTASRKKKV